MKHYSTAEVAKLASISKNTLLSWLYQGKVPEPKRHTYGGVDVRIWNERDLAHVHNYKAANFRKGRGRKKQQQ